MSDEIDELLEDDELEAELDALKKAELVNKKIKKKVMKRGTMIIVGIVALGGIGLISILSGVNNALEQNKVAAKERAQEQKRTSTNGIKRYPPNSNKQTSIKSAKPAIINSEVALEENRLEHAKEEQTSVISKLDSLREKKKKNSQKVTPLNRNRQSSSMRDKQLSSRLSLLFAAGGNFANEKPSNQSSKSLQTLETLVSEPVSQTNFIVQHNELAYLKEQKEGLKAKEVLVAKSEPSKRLLGISRRVTDEENAMLLMQIDSSKPSPITAVIMQADSDLDTAKLACDFTTASSQESVQITCSKLVFGSNTYPVNIILLDPASRNAGIADDVDKHWWKWLAFSAAAFADGYLQYATSTTTVVNTDGSQVTNSPAISEQAALNKAAAANIGRQALSQMGNVLSIPNTVYVNEYRPVTLLYLDDLDI